MHPLNGAWLRQRGLLFGILKFDCLVFLCVESALCSWTFAEEKSTRGIHGNRVQNLSHCKMCKMAAVEPISCK